MSMTATATVMRIEPSYDMGSIRSLTSLVEADMATQFALAEAGNLARKLAVDPQTLVGLQPDPMAGLLEAC